MAANTSKTNQKDRWENYVLHKGDEFENFWKNYFIEKKDMLYILGLGFDPRMCLGISSILDAGGKGIRDCMLIDFDEGPSSPSKKYQKNIDKNMQDLTTIISDKANLIQKQISFGADINSGSRKAASVISDISQLQKYSDIIVDISSMPTSIYFPLIGKILYLLDKEKESSIKNLHIIAAENTLIDSLIIDMEIEDRARYLFSFTSDLETESTKKHKIWIPILGENQEVQLDRIKTLVEPSEICPILPSPSVNPRRGDNLIVDYREHFDKMKVEIHNIIYGAEQNPFEVYRQLLATTHRYQEALETLGGCKVAISALSSKLLSVAPFLVAYESKTREDLSVGIAHVSAKGFEMKPEATDSSILDKTELFSLWIAGDCYEE